MRSKNILLAFLLVFFIAGCSINIGTKERAKSEATTKETQVKVEDNTNETIKYPDVDNSSAEIIIAQAKQTALDHANLNANNVILVEAYLERERDVLQYSIEFREGNRIHEFEVHAQLGKAIWYGYEIDD